jgi:hypothetical protein
MIPHTSALRFSLLKNRSRHPFWPPGPPEPTQRMIMTVSGVMVWNAAVSFLRFLALSSNLKPKYFPAKSCILLMMSHRASRISTSRNAYSGSASVVSCLIAFPAFSTLDAFAWRTLLAFLLGVVSHAVVTIVLVELRFREGAVDGSACGISDSGISTLSG